MTATFNLRVHAAFGAGCYGALTHQDGPQEAEHPKRRVDWRGFGRLVLQHIPFIGRLTFRGGVPWKKASAETAISVLLSSISIWIGALALSFAGLEPTWFSATDRVVANGELYLLSSGAVSPLFYITLIRYRSDEQDKWVTVFPHGVLYILSSIIVLGVSIVFIALRSVYEHPSTPDGFELTRFIGASWILYAFSLFLFFTASVHRNILEHTGPGILREDEGSFKSDFMKARNA